MLVNNGQGWDVATELSDDHPKATIPVRGYGQVDLDLPMLLRD